MGDAEREKVRQKDKDDQFIGKLKEQIKSLGGKPTDVTKMVALSRAGVTPQAPQINEVEDLLDDLELDECDYELEEKGYKTYESIVNADKEELAKIVPDKLHLRTIIFNAKERLENT